MPRLPQQGAQVIPLAMLAGLRPEGWKPPPQIGAPPPRRPDRVVMPRKPRAKYKGPGGGNSRARLRMWKRAYDAHMAGATLREAALAAGFVRPAYCKDAIERFKKLIQANPWLYDRIKTT